MAGEVTDTATKKAGKSKKAKSDEETKAKAAERKAAKEEVKEAKRKERAEARAAKDQEKKAAKQAELDKLIKDGKLIQDGTIEYHKVEKEEAGTVENRAAAILSDLRSATSVPILGRDLMNKHGGGWPQYLAIFAMLKALGYVVEYRSRGGDRGQSGVAYLWVA